MPRITPVHPPSTHVGVAYRPPQGPVAVAHVGDRVLVADKPAGLLTVPGRGPDKADCLASRMAERHGWVKAVHRLDMDTSGLVTLARDADMHRALSMAFAARQVHKRYVAVVWGCPKDDEGEVNAPLLVDWPNRPRQAVNPTDGKPSLTRWRVLSRDADGRTARLELEPVTGRSHQLRVHLMHIGHPIVGDDLYAPPEARAAAPRLLLHAAELTLPEVDGLDAPIALKVPPPF